MISITYDSKNLEKSVDTAKSRVSNWKPFFRSWADHYFVSRIEMFKTQGRSTGTPWPMYSRATKEHQYAAVKASIYGRRLRADDLLRWEGKNTLYNSLTVKGDVNSQIVETPNSISIGSKLSYAHSLSTGAYRMPKWAGSYSGVRRPLDGMGSYLSTQTDRLTKVHAEAVLGSFKDVGKRQENYF